MASASDGQSTASAEQEGMTAKEEEHDSSTAREESSGSGEESAESAETSGGSAEENAESGDQEEGVASGKSMASPIEDVSSLPGETVNDQDGRKIGEVKEIYAVGEDETPMWVTIESATGLGRKRQVFLPLARIKKQHDEIRVPYSFDHVHDSPDVEPGDEVSEEDDRALRIYYAIGLADQELVGSARSYASQVADDEGSARKIDADSAEGPARELDETPPAQRVAEAYEKQKEEEGEEHRSGRDATADSIFEEDGTESGESKGEDGESKGEDSDGSESRGDSDGSEDPNAQEKSDEAD